MSGYDAEMPSCSSKVQRRARKSHVCCACRENIPRGDLYVVWSGVWDDGPKAYKYCLRCWAMIQIILDTPGNEGFVHEMACGHEWYDIFECPPSPTMLALAFATREEMQQSCWARG